MAGQADVLPVHVLQAAAVGDQELEVADRSVASAHVESATMGILERAADDDVAVAGQELAVDRVVLVRGLRTRVIDDQGEPALMRRGLTVAGSRRLPEAIL